MKVEESKVRSVGCPPIYNDAESLRSAVDKYFSSPPTRKVSYQGQTTEIPCITITGLCVSLGFASRQSFYDYEKNEEFSYIIKRARLFIESDYEALLQNGQCTGAIFALKNMGWSDRQDITVDSDNLEPMSFSFSVLPAVSDVVVTKGKAPNAA